MSETTLPSKPTRRQAALNRLNQLEQKYFKLVWYIISHNDDCSDLFTGTPEAELSTIIERAKIYEMFPDEIDQLRCPQKGTWTHGFNGGMLCCVRLLLAYLYPQNSAADWDAEIEMAERDFPLLYI
jgi:hypothetical protein